MITELTEREILDKSIKAIQENQEIKRVVNILLRWLERGGDASYDHGLMSPPQIAEACREFLKGKGIDLS